MNTLGVIASAGVGVAEKLGIFIFLVPMSCMQAVSAFVANLVFYYAQPKSRNASPFQNPGFS